MSEDVYKRQLLRAIAEYSQLNREEFLETVKKAQTSQQSSEITRLKSRLTEAKKRVQDVYKRQAQLLCCDGPEGKCETLQSEKDWHISTESLFIVMKLVRVGELNAGIVE